MTFTLAELMACAVNGAMIAHTDVQVFDREPGGVETFPTAPGDYVWISDGELFRGRLYVAESGLLVREMHLTGVWKMPTDAGAYNAAGDLGPLDYSGPWKRLPDGALGAGW